MIEATEKPRVQEPQAKPQAEEPTMHNETDIQTNPQPQGGSRKLANPQDCLSDHAYQGAEINFFRGNQRLLSIHGRTWNLMNRCRSKQDQGTYKNNPWNITETDDAYNQRKSAQLKRILELCQQGGDYFCLQEVDCFYNKEWKDAFIKQLAAIGWGFVMTRQVDNAKANVVLYNKNTLQFSKTSRGILPIASGQNTGFAVNFVHTQSKEPVTVVSLHLDYMHDYTHDIPAFQKAQVNANRFTVMAGDVNHQPNTQITGLCNDWNHVTNLGGDDDGNLRHLDEDPSRHQRAKCYDGFFANPTQNSLVQIIERESEQFVPDATKPGIYYLESVNTGRSHQSLPGKPWVRGAHKKKAAEEQREPVASPKGTTEAPQPSVKTAFDLLVDLIRDDVWKSRHSQYAKYPNKVPIGLDKMRLALGTKASFTPSEKNALFQQFKKIAAGRDTWYSRLSFYQSRRHAKTKEFYNLLVTSNSLNDLDKKKSGLRGLMSAAASQVQVSPK